METGDGDLHAAPPSKHDLTSGSGVTTGTKPLDLTTTDSSIDLPDLPETGSTPPNSTAEGHVLEELWEVFKKITWDFIIDLVKGIIEDKIDEFMEPIRKFCRRNTILSGFLIFSAVALLIPIVLFFVLDILVFVLGLIVAVLLTVVGAIALILILVVMVVILVIVGALIAGVDAFVRNFLCCCIPDEDDDSERIYLMN